MRMQTVGIYKIQFYKDRINMLQCKHQVKIMWEQQSINIYYELIMKHKIPDKTKIFLLLRFQTEQ